MDEKERKLERLADTGDFAALRELWHKRKRTRPPWEWWPKKFKELRDDLLLRSHFYTVWQVTDKWNSRRSPFTYIGWHGVLRAEDYKKQAIVIEQPLTDPTLMFIFYEIEDTGGCSILGMKLAYGERPLEIFARNNETWRMLLEAQNVPIWFIDG